MAILGNVRASDPILVFGAIMALCIAITGCATNEHAGHAEIKIEVRGPGFAASRKIAGVSQSAEIYARSVYINPVARPVSHVTSLGSLVVKSTAGALHRIAIAAAGFPALDDTIPVAGGNAPMDLDRFEEILDRVTGTSRDYGSIEFLVGGEAYFTRLESAIDGARRRIDMRTYIFDNDDYAVFIADRLRERSRDVDVRVLVDGLGNMQALQVDADSQPSWHRPPYRMDSYLERDSQVRVRHLSNPWLTSDHTKTTIIDGEVAFVGGMNIGREYRYDWHDLMMEVRGPVVERLQHESDKAWAGAGPFGDLARLAVGARRDPADAGAGDYSIRVLKTDHFDADIYKAQLAAIRHARSYIYIENAYFSDDRTLYELARARRRGVDVRVILPEAGNHPILDQSNALAIRQMLRHGIRVYLYPGMSHVKAAIYDGWVCVGSANFDKLSLEINKELNIATSDPRVSRAILEQVFVPDLTNSREIDTALKVSVTARVAEIIVDELL